MNKFRNTASPHVHPLSFDSASTPESFAAREIELGTGFLTVTDHGTMAACRRVYDLGHGKGLTPILGMEGYFRDDDCPILKAHGIEDVKSYLKYCHVTIHARDAEAYFLLSRKLSSARLESHGSASKPLFSWKDLEELGAANVTIGSSCLVGMVSRHLLRDGLDLPQRMAIAEAYYKKLRGLTRPGNFIVEVFPHRCTHNWDEGIYFDFADKTQKSWYPKKKLKFKEAGEFTAADAAKAWGTKIKYTDILVEVKDRHTWNPLPEQPLLKIEHIEDFIANECTDSCPDGDVQKSANRVLMYLAKKYGDPVVVSDDSHYAYFEEKIVQDIRLKSMGSWYFFGNYARKTSDESFAYFKEFMGVSEKIFEGWLDNADAWSSGFKDFKFDSKISIPAKFYPEDSLKHTFDLIRRHGRMPWKDPKYHARLQSELDLLHRNGTVDLLPYFHLGEDVCSFYESIGELCGPGRGSASGLLTPFLMGITHVDPLAFDLSQDRFLTLDRIKSGGFPDIDQDLPHRDALVDGWKEQLVVVELEDGTTKEVRAGTIVDTTEGAMTIEEAAAQKADVTFWGAAQ